MGFSGDDGWALDDNSRIETVLNRQAIDEGAQMYNGGVVGAVKRACSQRLGARILTKPNQEDTVT